MAFRAKFLWTCFRLNRVESESSLGARLGSFLKVDCSLFFVENQPHDLPIKLRQYVRIYYVSSSKLQREEPEGADPRQFQLLKHYI